MSSLLANGALTLIAVILLQVPPSKSTGTGTPPPPTLHDLAGVYMRGDGYVIQELTVDKTGTFSFVTRQDVGQPMQTDGKAEVVDGYLVLRSTTERKAGQQQGRSVPFHVKFVPVVWGDYVYLTGDAEMIKLCNIVNLGVNRPHGPHPFWIENFFVRGKTVQAKVAGLPEVPAKWKPFLLKQSVHGRITKVTGKKKATVDLGAQNGLHPGMMLWVEGLGADGVVTVDSVSAKSCSVKIDDLVEKDKTLRAGQQAFSMIPAQALEKDWTAIWAFLTELRFERK
jgi:hypothetical protein